MNTVIEARGISKDISGVRIIDRVQFDIQAQQRFGIIGGVGAGKSTLLKMLGGVLPPSSGDLFVLGINTRTSGAAVRQRVGFMPQKVGLEAELTVFDNLLAYGYCFNLRGHVIGTRARHLLRITEMDEFSRLPVQRLTEAQLRRVAFARALINDPDVLILDNPTRDLANVDRQWFWKAIKKQSELGKTIILGSRDVEEVENLCGRIAILSKGQVTCLGEPEALIKSHVGHEVIEYEVADADIPYLVQRLESHFKYQIFSNRLKVFIPDNFDFVKALQSLPSERMIYRRARLGDVYAKLLGKELGGSRAP